MASNMKKKNRHTYMDIMNSNKKLGSKIMDIYIYTQKYVMIS